MSQFPRAKVPDSTWTLFHQIRETLGLAPEKEFVDDLVFFGQRVSRKMGCVRFHANCHMVCRALAKVFPVSVHDGAVHSFAEKDWQCGYQHSWLVPKGGAQTIIVDALPIGVVSGPTLVCVGAHTMQYTHCITLICYDRDRQAQARINYLANMFRRIAKERKFQALVA